MAGAQRISTQCLEIWSGSMNSWILPSHSHSPLQHTQEHFKERYIRKEIPDSLLWRPDQYHSSRDYDVVKPSFWLGKDIVYYTEHGYSAGHARKLSVLWRRTYYLWQVWLNLSVPEFVETMDIPYIWLCNCDLMADAMSMGSSYRFGGEICIHVSSVMKFQGL